MNASRGMHSGGLSSGYLSSAAHSGGHQYNSGGATGGGASYYHDTSTSAHAGMQQQGSAFGGRLAGGHSVGRDSQHRAQLAASVSHYHANAHLLDGAAAMHYRTQIMLLHQYHHNDMLAGASPTLANVGGGHPAPHAGFDSARYDLLSSHDALQDPQEQVPWNANAYAWRFGRILGDPDGARRICPSITYIVDFDDPVSCFYLPLHFTRILLTI